MRTGFYRRLGEFLPPRLPFQTDVRRRYLEFLLRKGIRFTTVRADGRRMMIDLEDLVISRCLFLDRTWEPFETLLLSRSLRPGITFVDVGAHIGYYSLLAAQALGPSGRVFSFEPSPGNFDLLRQNIKLNHLGGIVQAENAALSRQPGELTLHLASYNTGDHRIYETSPDDDEIFNASLARKSVRVPAITLDDYLAERRIDRVDVLKIDVQGAEMGVLLGMRGTLSRSAGLVMFIEYWPHGLSRSGTPPIEMLNFLTREAGLALFHIQPEARRVVPIDPVEFAGHAAALDPRDQIDLIACRSPQAWFAQA